MLTLVLAAWAQEAPPIVNGSTTRDYEQVVTLYAADSDGYGYNFCSGTLIASKWVITAAHCVVAMDDNESYGYPYLLAIVGYDLNSSSGVQDYAYAKSWTAHPGYNDSNLHNDIGVVELQTAITSIDYAAVNKDSIRSSMVGDEYRYVGWGITSDSGTDSSKKRTADMPLYDYDDYFMIGYDPVDNQNVCSGDSGGAAFELDSSGNVYELAGVNSYVADDDSTPCAGGQTGGTRVDKYIDWIEGYTPVYSASEMSDADTDTDTDSDTDSDTDADTDTDTDSDTDADTDTDAGPSTDLAEDPLRPDAVGEDYSTESMFCATTTPSGAGWALLVAAGALVARRRR